METITLGKTGLKVSRLGAGLAAIGEELTMSEISEASNVLNSALDGGILFLDTAPCYFISEELVGRTIAHRRDEYILATKCGHATGGYIGESWTYQTIQDSIERSLMRMQTDHLDLVQLHSCDIDVLNKGEAIRALQDAKKAGKTRFIGYSGDNDAALWAVESDQFDTLQTSFSLLDQNARLKLFEPVKSRQMGLIAKRPIANGAWGSKISPSKMMRYNNSYTDEYFRRSQIMESERAVINAPDDNILLALGFIFGHPEIDIAIVGTRNPEHMLNNIKMVEQELPISTEAIKDLHERFMSLDFDLLQQR